MKDTGCFAKTCRLFRDITQVDLLFELAKYGQLKYVERMVAAQPELLLKRKTFIDTSGVRRHVERTVYQYFLGSIDPEFCRVLLPYFKNIKNGETERINQTLEQYSEILTEMTASTEFITELAQLIKAFNANEGEINQALICHKTIPSSRNFLIDAIEKFSGYLRTNESIRTGSHFNTANFLAVLVAYSDNLDNWTPKQARLYSIKVIADFITLLPRPLLFACIQGFRYMIRDGVISKLKRPFISNYTAQSLFSDETYCEDLLGRDFFIDTDIGVERTGGRGEGTNSDIWSFYNEYITQIFRDMESLCNRIESKNQACR